MFSVTFADNELDLYIMTWLLPHTVPVYRHGMIRA